MLLEGSITSSGCGVGPVTPALMIVSPIVACRVDRMPANGEQKDKNGGKNPKKTAVQRQKAEKLRTSTKKKSAKRKHPPLPPKKPHNPINRKQFHFRIRFVPPFHNIGSRSKEILKTLLCSHWYTSIKLESSPSRMDPPHPTHSFYPPVHDLPYRISLRNPM